MITLKSKVILSILSLLVLNFISCNSAGQKEKDGWDELFNGENLKGWEQLNGKAKYTVEEGAIVGITVTNSPNSFLCTEKMYGDFILEFEVWADPSVNSGVQFRSNSFKDYNDGRVHGYQFEIESTNRAFSGGIYDEGRRGWMYPLTLNEKGRKAFEVGNWNSCRIEAVGTTIRTWINGVQCTNLIDDKTALGFIGLQVHDIGDNESNEGKKIKWKNIRIKTENIDKERWPIDDSVVESSYLINQLTDYEIKNGWKLLWDGKTSNGWKGAKQDPFPASWEIKDGELTVLETPDKEPDGSGDIITNELYSDFELELQFNITTGANSGIKYFVDTEINKGPGWEIGCEFQIMDDENHPDAKEGINGNRTIGSLYDLIPPKNISVPGREKQFKGVGYWNKARIISKGNKVTHWLNDEKVVEYDRSSQMFEDLVAVSKYKNWPNFGQWPSGHILLQDHGNTVHFRSIKIREFN